MPAFNSQPGDEQRFLDLFRAARQAQPEETLGQSLIRLARLAESMHPELEEDADAAVELHHPMPLHPQLPDRQFKAHGRALRPVAPPSGGSERKDSNR